MRPHPFVLLAALTAGFPAHAVEPATGTLIPGRSTSSPVYSELDERQVEEAALAKSPTFESDLKVARAIMDCVVEKKPIVAVNYLNAFFEDRQRKMNRPYAAALSRCMYDVQKASGSDPGWLKVSWFTNYSLLAEAYLRHHSVPDLKVVPLEELTESSYYRESRFDYQLSACLAYTQPSAAKELVTSAIGSAEEKKAFALLAPLIPACVPAGATLKLEKTWLRLRLATSLYLRDPPKSPRSSTHPARDAS